MSRGGEATHCRVRSLRSTASMVATGARLDSKPVNAHVRVVCTGAQRRRKRARHVSWRSERRVVIMSVRTSPTSPSGHTPWPVRSQQRLGHQSAWGHRVGDNRTAAWAAGAAQSRVVTAWRIDRARVAARTVGVVHAAHKHIDRVRSPSIPRSTLAGRVLHVAKHRRWGWAEPAAESGHHRLHRALLLRTGVACPATPHRRLLHVPGAASAVGPAATDGLH